jgi:hypothetical protein
MKNLSTKALIALAAAVISAFAVGGVALAAKPTDNTRPGWGYGDKNHVHTGPPGQSVRP